MRPLVWVGSSKKDLEDAIYALHAFQKKSKSGIETPKAEIEKVKARLEMADVIHATRKAAATIQAGEGSQK